MTNKKKDFDVNLKILLYDVPGFSIISIILYHSIT